MLDIILLRLMQGIFALTPMISYLRNQVIIGPMILSIMGMILSQHIYKVLKQK